MARAGSSTPHYETDTPVLYEVDGPIAWITMNRPQFHNAQNSQMTYALDRAFSKATDDSQVKVIVLRGAGKHFSAGHDIGSPGRDVNEDFSRIGLLPTHTDRQGAEFLYTREHEVYLGMCRRWRALPKPTIAMVHGGCIAGGLMLAWVCDLIVACETAFFQDPVARMGIPGVEYFAHPFELPPRVAKEFLLLGERMSAQEAGTYGMVNRVVEAQELENTVRDMAGKIASRPPLGNWLVKQAVNHAEDLRGKHTALDAVYHMHHFAHAQNELLSGHTLGGLDAKAMAHANKAEQKA
ncbi:putative enoyl-CoA hydratase echA8 [Pseudovibrio sp. Ad26]|nr:enoyl-CoA hydratase [Pseudovibrio sp. POLY-S9]KZL15206.1 putative enoyl-CoA hydratase echA8 [Pseudovibrio sp. Ad26]